MSLYMGHANNLPLPLCGGISLLYGIHIRECFESVSAEVWLVWPLAREIVKLEVTVWWGYMRVFNVVTLPPALRAFPNGDTLLRVAAGASFE